MVAQEVREALLGFEAPVPVQLLFVLPNGAPDLHIAVTGSLAGLALEQAFALLKAQHGVLQERQKKK